MLRDIKKVSKILRVGKEVLTYIGRSSLVGRQVKSPWIQRELRAKLIQKHAKEVLKNLKMEIEVVDPEAFLLKDNALIVSNHMSYLDILVLSSINPSCFITSVEMRNTPVLGYLADLGGSVYVERRNKTNLGKEISEITTALNRGLNVCFFPEATSHNGEELLRFRKPLFNAARYAHKKILPVCINYYEIDGEEFSISNRDKVCWYGDRNFASHLWDLCGTKRVKVKVEFLESISEPQKIHSRDLASQTQSLVSEHFFPAK